MDVALPKCERFSDKKLPVISSLRHISALSVDHPRGSLHELRVYLSPAVTEPSQYVTRRFFRQWHAWKTAGYTREEKRTMFFVCFVGYPVVSMQPNDCDLFWSSDSLPASWDAEVEISMNLVLVLRIPSATRSSAVNESLV